MGLKSKRKGNRIERELVQRHKAAGIDAERVPLSGAAGGTFTGDLRIQGDLKAEVKARAGGDGFKTLERWLQSQARYQAQEAEKIATLRWSELNWPGRIRRTRFLGPPVVALHCLLVKRLAFDGSAGLLYTAQRVTAELILSMYLLRRDLDRLLAAKAAE